MTPTDRRWLLMAIGISLVARIAIVVAAAIVNGGPDGFYVPDSHQYEHLARAIVEGKYATAGRPELYRPPGYPALLAIGVALGTPTALTLALQVMLGVVTTVACFAMGRAAGGGRLGACAAVLYACEPGQWIHGAFILSETLFTSCLALALAAAIRYLQTPERRWIVATALLTGAAAYVRPIGYVLPAVLLLALASLEARRPRRPHWWRDYALAVVAVVALVGAWHVRNGVTAGYWGFSQQFERAAYFSAGASAWDRSDPLTPVARRRALDDEADRAADRTRPQERADFMWTAAAHRVVQHLPGFLLTYSSGIAATALHPGGGTAVRLFGGIPAGADRTDSATRLLVYGQWSAARETLAAKGVVYWGVTILLGATTLIYIVLFARGLLRHWRRPVVQLAGVVTIVLLLLSGGPDADSRRRVPVVPAMCLVAAMAIAGRDQA